MSVQKTAPTSAPTGGTSGQSSGGGSNAGLYILGFVVVAAALAGGWYLYAKPASKIAKSPDDAAATGGDGGSAGGKVPLTDKSGNPVIGKDGNPVKVAASSSSSPAATGGATSGSGAASGTASTTSSSGTPANDYVDGATIDKRNAETNFKPYNAAAPDQAGFTQSISDLLGLHHKSARPKYNHQIDQQLKSAETYVRGFMKGLNMALRADYVGIFGSAITDYMNNPAKVNEATVSVGEFLKA